MVPLARPGAARRPPRQAAQSAERPSGRRRAVRSAGGRQLQRDAGRGPLDIHLAEGTDAIARGELGRLEALGCLAANTVIVHGVGLSPADIGRVVARSAGVVWCPSSNLALLGATLAPRRLFEAGRLALGTDARLSGARDLLDELGGAAARDALTPGELVRLATSDAARLLAMPEVGGLGPVSAPTPSSCGSTKGREW